MTRPTLAPPPEHFTRLKQEVIDSGLCVRCGVCTGSCPVSCLAMDPQNPLPHLVPGLECTSCGLCVAACPERGVDYAGISRWLFGTSPDAGDIGGAARGGFVGHVVDETVWRTTSGGGLVTGLLLHLLERGGFDGALVAGFDTRERWRAVPRIVYTRDQVLENTRSKHSLVATADLLRLVRERPGRYVLVGAGCHVSGLRKLQQLDPLWQDRIPLVIGIACGGNWYPEGTQYLLRGMGVDDTAEVVDFAYRAVDGTGANLQLANGERRSTGKRFGHDVYRMNLLYHAEGCTACPDLLSILADITVGDTGPGKQSFAFSRSSAGLEALSDAVNSGVITGAWRDPHPRRGLRSDHPARVRLKYREAYSTIALRRSAGLPVPDYGAFAVDARPLWTHRWDRWLWEAIYHLVHNRSGRWLLAHLPADWTYTLGKLRGAWEFRDPGFWSGLRKTRPRSKPATGKGVD